MSHVLIRNFPIQKLKTHASKSWNGVCKRALSEILSSRFCYRMFFRVFCCTWLHWIFCEPFCEWWLDTSYGTRVRFELTRSNPNESAGPDEKLKNLSTNMKRKFKRNPELFSSVLNCTHVQPSSYRNMCLDLWPCLCIWVCLWQYLLACVCPVTKHRPKDT